jgi:hypothetical protein
MRFVRLVLRCVMSRTKNYNKKKTHSNFHSVVIKLYAIDCVTLRCVTCSVQRIPNKNKIQELSLNSTVGCIALRNVSATDMLSLLCKSRRYVSLTYVALRNVKDANTIKNSNLIQSSSNCTIDFVTLRCVTCSIQRIAMRTRNIAFGLSLNSTAGRIALRYVSATDMLSLLCKSRYK